MIREASRTRNGPDSRRRVREAIAIANNEIYRLSAPPPGMGTEGRVSSRPRPQGWVATIGHVGDTRMYKIR